MSEQQPSAGGWEVVRVAQKATQRSRATQRQRSSITARASQHALVFFLLPLNDFEMMQFKLFISYSFLKEEKKISQEQQKENFRRSRT